MTRLAVQRAAPKTLNCYLSFRPRPFAPCAVLSTPRGQHRLTHSSRKVESSTNENFDEMRFANPPLSLLPLRMVIRSLFTSAVSSSPLLPLSLRIMSAIAHSTNPLLDPDRNPVLRYVLDKSLYAQFCAGGDQAQVQATVSQLKRIGFTGVILAYAKEAPEQPPDQEAHAIIEAEIEHWAEHTLETVRMTESGDFVAVKFTGAGRLASDLLSHNQPPSPHLSKSIDRVCQLAQERGVRLLFDGEQDVLQDGIDAWTMQFASKYNTKPGCATIYGTYQAYKKSIREVLSRHLVDAREGGFTLGVKLVRGAYLQSDPRDRFYSEKAETDACYDNSAASVLKREWNDTVQGDGNYPPVSLMLATHNATSVRRAYAIQHAGKAKAEVSFAQLQGMADEISCELVQVNKVASAEGTAKSPVSESVLPVYKYMAWGSTGECIKYLLRRAQENRDAVHRTREDRDAMWGEVVRRLKLTFGIA